jgi:hypothetical protein
LPTAGDRPCARSIFHGQKPIDLTPHSPLPTPHSLQNSRREPFSRRADSNG